MKIKYSNISDKNKKVLDKRLNHYFKNPNDVTNWDTFTKELEKEVQMNILINQPTINS